MSRGNQLDIIGKLIERNALRHTPAGIAVLDFRVRHESEQVEAGVTRRADCEIACLAVENGARLMAGAPLGAEVRLVGFLAAKGKSGRQLVLHVSNFEFVEGV